MSSKNRNKSIGPRTVIIGLLLLTAAVSGVCVIGDQLEYVRQKTYQESIKQLALSSKENEMAETEVPKEPEETADTIEESSAPYVSPIDFDALQKENPDTVGWLRIPGTNIDYPIVQTDNNETYLHKDFQGNESQYGAIYLDCDSDPEFMGWNHPIYGHHMKDGSMFKDVVKYKEEAYFKEHQFFELYTPWRTIHLKAIACYNTGSDGIVRKTKFNSRENFEAWMKERLEPCAFGEIPSDPVDSMFVLVTCSYETEDARTLLYAVEVDAPVESSEEAASAANTKIINSMSNLN